MAELRAAQQSRTDGRESDAQELSLLQTLAVEVRTSTCYLCDNLQTRGGTPLPTGMMFACNWVPLSGQSLDLVPAAERAENERDRDREKGGGGCLDPVTAARRRLSPLTLARMATAVLVLQWQHSVREFADSFKRESTAMFDLCLSPGFDPPPPKA